MAAPLSAPSRVPALRAGADLRALPLKPVDAYLLAQIDGVATEAELATLTGIAQRALHAGLDRLRELGAIEFRGEPPPPVPSREIPRTSDSGSDLSAVRSRGVRNPSGSTPIIPREDADGGASSHDDIVFEPSRPKLERSRPEVASGPHPAPCDLSAEQQAHLHSLAAALDTLDHYALLGLARDADKKAIKRAYLATAAEYHPDRHFGVQLGELARVLDSVFARITNAYETLLAPDRRAAYDAELAGTPRKHALALVILRRIGVAHVPPPAPPAQVTRSDLPPAPSVPQAIDSTRVQVPMPRFLRDHNLRPDVSPLPLPPGPFDPGDPATAYLPYPDGVAPPSRHLSPPTGVRAMTPPMGTRAVTPPTGTRAATPPQGSHAVATTQGARAGSTTSGTHAAVHPAAARSMSPPSGTRAPSVPPPPPATHDDEAARRAALAMRLGAPPPSVGARQGDERSPDARAAVDDLMRRSQDARRGQVQRYVDAAREAERDGDHTGASNAYRLALSLDPENAEVIRGLDASSGRASSSVAAAHLKKADEEYRVGHWAEAAHFFVRAAAGMPDDAGVHHRAAVSILRAAGDLAVAIDLGRKALMLAPQDLEVRTSLVEIYLAAGLLVAARGEIARVRALDPAHPKLRELTERAR